MPHGGHIKPFTTAETMNAGWCWNTPSVEDDHRGYVFSSQFLSDDEAAEEMRSKNPGMGDHRVIRFKTGRREHFWKGNVVAIGNSYGFVEPLESTGLHMIILEINQLVLNFPRSKKDTAIRGIVNRTLNAHWDDVRWFLAVHYRFNKKLDTPFWQACRNAVDIGGAQERVDLFRERTPLTYRQSQFFKPEEVFGDFAYDVLLLGQRVPGALPRGQPAPRRVAEARRRPARAGRERPHPGARLRDARTARPRRSSGAWSRRPTPGSSGPRRRSRWPPSSRSAPQGARLHWEQAPKRLRRRLRGLGR